ncbi:DNA polymerase III subunit epsilon [Halomonas denitrificans]|uniref:DNA polymerase III subunit epsilon n=1 Tax=Halomonas TaxID=2745 RepID=UPI001A8E4FD1|nr:MULTISPECIES: DNA polymerase III subunit epsilon [Halomonas]MED5294382.1 DNA polymerase III subunit epsilon [Pseudomonadota bacterium]MBN8411321.1 DNA polymerase III subunit epsilon [Halomonas litopenaei]MBY5925940.1 DNA polymerase III subunit epsilon [Halomonas sp. DP4Y7-2]MBY5927672.1 DNA polymerase III subunit epsilon [Halomonas sp. DP8Y7-3]MBY5969757.1 DNA polymerase III subunit epsilon [Halomonas denitrificans]
MRQIVLDTETTGIETRDGHRMIEIGAVEMINRRLTGNTYHQYINPERDIDAEAIGIHGITNERVANEPVFADVAAEFWDFIRGAELVIHNAPFDVGFIDHEFSLLKATRPDLYPGPVRQHCGVLDTLTMARELHPGQRNSLDALCKRYDIDNGHRVLHGALLDAEILADVYLAMTGGQTALTLDAGDDKDQQAAVPGELSVRRLSLDAGRLTVIRPDEDEQQAHLAKLDAVRSKAGQCHWDHLAPEYAGLGQPKEESH